MKWPAGRTVGPSVEVNKTVETVYESHRFPQIARIHRVALYVSYKIVLALDLSSKSTDRSS